MIRIDLGKDELKRAPSESSRAPLSLSQLQLDGRGIALIVASLAFSFVPFLFVEQYKTAYRVSHERRIQEIKTKQDTLKQDIARFKTYKLEMESYEQQKRMISERLAVVQQFISNRNSGVNVLDAVGQAIVPRAWLDSIDVVFSPQPKVTIAGKSYANEDVSDVIERLSQSIHLSDVSLDSVGAEMVGTRPGARNFQITAMPKGYSMPSIPSRDATSVPGTMNPPGQKPGSPPAIPQGKMVPDVGEPR